MKDEWNFRGRRLDHLKKCVDNLDYTGLFEELVNADISNLKPETPTNVSDYGEDTAAVFSEERLLRIAQTAILDMFYLILEETMPDSMRLLRFLALKAPEVTLNPKHRFKVYDSDIGDPYFNHYTYLLEVLCNGIVLRNEIICSLFEEILRVSCKKYHRHLKRAGLLTKDDLTTLTAYLDEKEDLLDDTVEDEDLRHSAFILLSASAMNIQVSENLKRITADAYRDITDEELLTYTEEEKLAAEEILELDKGSDFYKEVRALVKINSGVFNTEDYDDMDIITEAQKILELMTLIEQASGSNFGICNIFDESMGNPDDYHTLYIIATAIVLKIWPEKKNNGPLISAIVAIFGLMRHYNIVSQDMTRAFDEMFSKIEEKPDFEIKHVDLSRIRVNSEKKSPEAKESVTKKSVTKNKNEKADTKKQIRDLQEQLEQKRHAYQEISDQYNELKKNSVENEKTIADLTEEVDKCTYELKTLRNYLFSITNEDSVDSSETAESYEEKVRFLRDKRVVIVGGDPNWVNKLRKEFPGWVFISPAPNNTVLEAPLCNAEKIFVFTKTLSHSMWYKVVGVLRDYDLKYSYIHDVNIRKNVDQIYGEFR